MLMKKSLAEYLASYGTSISYDDLPPQVIHKVKALLIDTFACGMAGYFSKPSEIARRIASGISECNLPASIIGIRQKSTPELATFANGVMIRYLDLNDGYISAGDRAGGHPSDNFAPILSCADAVHAGGKEIITAVVLAYEIFCRFADCFAPASKGFDQAVIGVISAVLGASKILRLTQEQMVQAINLAVSSNISLGQIREGELSMWKGCSVANASKNAVFSALLAREGMTGPSSIFEGSSGFFKIISGPIQLKELGGKGRPFGIMDVMNKRYPCGMVAQTAVDAAIKLREKFSTVDDIAAVKISTTTSARNAMADNREKWRPSTRESADHSLPYVVAVALMHGSVKPKHFDDKYLHNPSLLELIQKISIKDTDECNRLFPEAVPNRIDLLMRTGENFSEMVLHHRGHPKNPLTDREIEDKFHSLVGDLIPLNQRAELLSLIWSLDDIDDSSVLMQPLIM